MSYLDHATFTAFQCYKCEKVGVLSKPVHLGLTAQETFYEVLTTNGLSLLCKDCSPMKPQSYIKAVHYADRPVAAEAWGILHKGCPLKRTFGTRAAARVVLKCRKRILRDILDDRIIRVFVCPA